MGLNVVYRQAKIEDAARLAEKLRLSDIRELVAVHGDDVDIREILEQSIKISHHVVAADTIKGELMALFGVAVCNQEANIAAPWMLLSEGAIEYGFSVSSSRDEFSKQLARDARKFVADWKSQFSGLINFVDARNTTSVRWLMRIGFKIHEPIKYGKMGLPFHPFTL